MESIGNSNVTANRAKKENCRTVCEHAREHSALIPEPGGFVCPEPVAFQRGGNRREPVSLSYTGKII